MAPPNGVPPSTDNSVYMSTTTTIPQESNNTTEQETNTQQTQEQQPVVCVNCKQNQKEGDAKDTEGLLKEVPNNNVQIVKAAKSNGDTKLDTSKDPDDENLEEEADLIVPPDGGWGWVIAFASFMCNMVVDGIIFSFGMFLPYIIEDFQVSKAKVALVGSLLSGFYLLVGPFVSALANRYGFRLVAIMGSFLSAGAFVLSYFATSVEFLFISYGFLGGEIFKRDRTAAS